MDTEVRPGLATRAYVISPKEIEPGWVTLYAITFVIEVFCAAARATLAYPVLWVIFKILGRSTTPVHFLALVIGYGPLAASLATLILPLGGWIWEQTSGGRTPSERERLVYEDAMAVLTLANPDLRPPRRWFVLDETYVNAAAYADTLMVTRGLLESGHLDPVLAHELGHLNSSDARVAAAVHRLTTPPRWKMPFPFRTISFLCTGALGVWLTAKPWAAYWRAREFEADKYAASLGQSQELARFLDGNALVNDLPVPFMWMSQHSHPATEHRIDRLHQMDVPA